MRELFSRGGEDYLIADNPGSRRGSREEREKLSFSKSRSELERADIALLVVDGAEGPSRQDARLIQLCSAQRKPVILILNKRDLLMRQSAAERERKTGRPAKGLSFFPRSAQNLSERQNRQPQRQIVSADRLCQKQNGAENPNPRAEQLFFPLHKKSPGPCFRRKRCEVLLYRPDKQKAP